MGSRSPHSKLLPVNQQIMPVLSIIVNIQKLRCTYPSSYCGCTPLWIQGVLEAWRRNLDSTIHMHSYMWKDLHNLSTGWHLKKSIFKADIPTFYHPVLAISPINGNKSNTLKGLRAASYLKQLCVLCTTILHILVCRMLLSAVGNISLFKHIMIQHSSKFSSLSIGFLFSFS